MKTYKHFLIPILFIIGVAFSVNGDEKSINDKTEREYKEYREKMDKPMNERVYDGTAEWEYWNENVRDRSKEERWEDRIIGN